MTRRNFISTAAAAVASHALPPIPPPVYGRMTLAATSPDWGSGPDRGAIVKGTRDECTGVWTWTVVDPRDFYLADSSCP